MFLYIFFNLYLWWKWSLKGKAEVKNWRIILIDCNPTLLEAGKLSEAVIHYMCGYVYFLICLFIWRGLSFQEAVIMYSWKLTMYFQMLIRTVFRGEMNFLVVRGCCWVVCLASKIIIADIQDASHPGRTPWSTSIDFVEFLTPSQTQRGFHVVHSGPCI